MNLRRWIPRIVLIALVAAGATFLVLKKPWAKGDDAITFQTVPVTKGTIAAQVTANGTLSARTTVLVGAQVSGKVVELHADFNDHVTKGQIIAKLDESVLRAQIDQAQASYDLAIANQKKSEVALADANRQYTRQKSLQDQQLVAGVTVETAQVTADSDKAALAASKAQVSQAYANLAQAKTNLGYATIYAPIDGIVLSRAVDEGQTVAASLSAPTLFTIAQDLASMQIDTAVAESDVGRLKDGMDAQFTVDAFTGKTFIGKVRQVRNSPTTTQGVVTYDAVIDVDNSEHLLRPGMTANVTFVLAQVTDAIKIPNAALRFKPTTEQKTAMREMSGAGSGGRGNWGGGSGGRGSGGHHRGSGGSGASDAGGPPPDMAGGGGPPTGMGGGSGGKRDLGDRKMLWKLVDGKPQMVIIKPGLTDGSTTELVEGDLKPDDLLITSIEGISATPTRKMGAF